MIYRASIEVQTQDYATSEAAITELVKSCGGYFESKSLSNRSSGYRYGEFTVRVPAAEYEHFCEQVGSLCHVTYMSSSAENITEEYYDTDSRLKTAQIKLERLQELLSKADNMADIITIESAISDTEYEIESLSGTLRHYDALVDYATVSLTLSETYKLDENEGAPLTFGARIARAFTNGLRDTGVFLEDLAIGIANNLVFLAVLAARRGRRARGAQKEAVWQARQKEKQAPRRRGAEKRRITDKEKTPMKLTWLGHSCFAVESGGYRVVLDPYYVESYPPLHTSANEVLCSHHHRDHDFVEAVELTPRGAVLHGGDRPGLP